MPHVCLSPNGVDVSAIGEPPSELAVATYTGVARLTRAGEAWSVAGTALDGLHVSSLAREPASGVLFAGVHGEGLYRSCDDGRTWEPATNGLAQRHVFSLACVPGASGAVVYAGTEPAHLYRSTDLGASWEELSALRRVAGVERWSFPASPHDPHVKHVAFDPRDPRRLFVSIEQGALLGSDDGGETFREIGYADDGYELNNDVHRVVFSPHDPDELYLDGGEGIARSRDGGRTWERLTTPAMRVTYPDHLYVAPDRRDRLFVSGGGTRPSTWRRTGDARSTVVRSDDGGRTWTPVGGGLPDALPGNIEAMAFAAWPDGYGFFAGTTDGEIYASTDRGTTWARIAAGLPPISKCVHYTNLVTGRAKVAAGSRASDGATC